MKRIACPERDDWRQTADDCGFDFCEIDGQRYWDERAYYQFSLKEIDVDIEAATAEIEAMCLELVDRALADDAILTRLKIPPAFWPLLHDSWQREDRSLYGRLDLSFSGQGPAKLLEYNADTPTSIFEAAVFQWTWLEQSIERRVLPGRADQYNSIHERLIARWEELGPVGRLHLTGMTGEAEDAGTLAYLADTAAQAGLATEIIDIADIGWRDKGGGFVDLDTNDMALVFKLYPWEWMFHDTFGARLPEARTRWIEPPWKALLSNKGILPLLWQMFEGHPNLLPAFFEDDPKAARLGTSFVRKPLYSREGANVSLVADGVAVSTEGGPYGAEGFVRQALAPLPDFGGVYPVVGSWLVAGEPCGLSIREDATPITGNGSRFLPHAIL
ncbi:MAG: glutathionylspermidine synthase family protein [Bradyrhizobium sp.]|uniref:glutathionylspermidine synthase family protein n=1 Tax=Bradyrhizobium sp. TaxID=376 RepID=UPI003C7C77C7